MRKFILIALLVLFSSNLYPQEVLDDLTKKESISTLNEELRKLREDMRSVTAQRLAGTTVQVVNYQSGTRVTNAATMPTNNSIPVKTDGYEYMTLAITPTSATNKLLIEVVFNGMHANNADDTVVALFQDTTTNALACTFGSPDASCYLVRQYIIKYYMTAGTTSATAFKVRAGSTTGATAMNGSTTSDYFGGVLISSITITEIKV